MLWRTGRKEAVKCVVESQNLPLWEVGLRFTFFVW